MKFLFELITSELYQVINKITVIQNVSKITTKIISTTFYSIRNLDSKFLSDMEKNLNVQVGFITIFQEASLKMKGHEYELDLLHGASFLK